MEKKNYVKIYDVENVYDGHHIYHMMKDILHLDCQKEIKYRGEDIYIRKDQYFIALKFVNSELLRREPENEVKWIDYYGKSRPYNKFCFIALELRDEYDNNEMLFHITQELNELFNNNSNDLEGKAPIYINTEEDRYIYLEGNICYDNKEQFWRDLRTSGLTGVFGKRRKYCDKIIKANIQNFQNYFNKYYIPTIDGELDEEINLQNDLVINSTKQKIIKKS